MGDQADIQRTDANAKRKLKFLEIILIASGLLVGWTLGIAGDWTRTPLAWIPYSACFLACAAGLTIAWSASNFVYRVKKWCLELIPPLPTPQAPNRSRLLTHADNCVYLGGMSGLILMAIIIMTTGGVIVHPWSTYPIIIPAFAGLVRINSNRVMTLVHTAVALMIAMFLTGSLQVARSSNPDLLLSHYQLCIAFVCIVVVLFWRLRVMTWMLAKIRTTSSAALASPQIERNPRFIGLMRFISTTAGLTTIMVCFDHYLAWLGGYPITFSSNKLSIMATIACPVIAVATSVGFSAFSLWSGSLVNCHSLVYGWDKNSNKQVLVHVKEECSLIQAREDFSALWDKESKGSPFIQLKPDADV